MTKKIIWILLILLVFINVSYAKTKKNIKHSHLHYASQESISNGSDNLLITTKPTPWQLLKTHWWFNPVLTFSTGLSFSQVGEPLNYSPIDLCFYDYNPNDSYSRTLLLGGFIGTEIPFILPQWNLEMGIGYYHHNNFSASGTLTQGADAASASTYQYNYQVRSNQVLAEGKLLWKLTEKLRPYFSFGIGSAFNEAYGYKTDVPYYFEYTPSYDNHSQASFSYAIGGGFDVNLFKQWKLGVGYRFSDLGEANLGPGMIDTVAISSTLKQRHLYDHQLLLQITYMPLIT